MPLTLAQRFGAVIVVGFTGAAPAVAQAPVAAGSVSVSRVSASTPSKDACNGKPKEHILKTYTVRTYPPVPLRCGTVEGFGFNKLVAKGRWSSEFDEKIQETLLRGQEVQKSGTSHTFALGDLPPCPGHFRVVIEYKLYDSPGFQGVINAYHTDDPSTLLAEQSPQGYPAKQSPC